MLEMIGLTKRYGQFTALSEFSAVLQNGIYGLLGPNGAGKSTLLNLLVTLKKPTVGKILLDGKEIRQLKGQYLRELGYMPQYSGFYGSFTAAEYLRYFCAAKGLPRDIWEHRIAELLDYVHLTEAAGKKIKGFSGGMKQRLAIAQALLNNPALLILDEPTAGLDPQERIRFRNMLSNLSENRIILLATHIVPDIEAIANEVILLQNGQKLAQASPAELMRSMQGKVWSLRVPEQEIGVYMQKHQVSNAYHHDMQYTVRIVSDAQPDSAACPAEPTLDDVYLYYCGETSIC